ncbi:hypothetical protein [Sphingomonas lycopersici]|uniref:Uncharacterized protein n=1 Tax=Sphingomonas lycopersici TaxID=2951807 RepID=A0AA41ZB29_9SPHN|nr:hypothetical protein [Sphingomonas lycopersici]MCW6536288.1 hypothetical protein [Sphingomonas lycopersici]
MGENRQRLDELLRRRRRAALVPKAVEAWAALGVAASPLSADRQADLIARLRASGRHRSGALPEASSRHLSKDIDDFAWLSDLLIVIGWDVDEEPALLLPAEAISRCATHLRSLYPDGFLMLDQPATSALVVDFDEDHFSAVYVDRVPLLSGE